MAVRIFHDDDARQRVLKGAETLYNAVKTTMGPKGRNVVISSPYGPPRVTHDGVSVAKAVELKDTEETLGQRTGAELIKSAASKMNDAAGDGTTTVTVLTYHLLKEANKLIAAGHNPMQLRAELEKAAEIVPKALSDWTEDIAGNKERIAQVATVSAGGDKTIGELIADVIETVGQDGVVTVEEGQGTELEQEVVEGFSIDRGFISPHMVTDGGRQVAVYKNAAVIVTDKTLSNAKEIVPLLEHLANAGRKELLLIADDVTGDALNFLIINKLQGAFNTVAIKAPSFSERRKEILEDIAILTGATVISDERGGSFETVDPSVIGSARKVIVSKDSTAIIGGAGAGEDISVRIEQLKGHVEKATDQYEREHLKSRHASLSGKVAVIRVGGTTETEINEKKDRVDDAVCAAKAALQEGIVPGGGMTTLKLSETIDTTTSGGQILAAALQQPFRMLLTNAGISPDRYDPHAKTDWGCGVDVRTGELVNLLEEGIVDPTAVTRQAIQNAVSIAGTAMTMGALVVDVPEEKVA